MTLRAAPLPALLALVAMAACATPPPPGPDIFSPGGLRPMPIALPDPRGTYEGGRYGDGPFPNTIEATATGDELAFVRGILSEIQIRSFRENRELCGYIGLSPEGRWVSTPVMEGSEASCPLPPVPTDMRVAASFHTHSTYSPVYASEWPTTQDVLTDADSGIDGYIATPGGRFWHVDTDTMRVIQICGRGCLPQDPNYVAADDGPIEPVMTLARLRQWESTAGPE